MQSFNHQNILATYTCEGDLADIRDTNRRKDPSLFSALWASCGDKHENESPQYR